MRFILICLLFMSAFSEAALADRSLALIFQPARASDADKVAQLRKLIATVFADRGDVEPEIDVGGDHQQAQQRGDRADGLQSAHADTLFPLLGSPLPTGV